MSPSRSFVAFAALLYVVATFAFAEDLPPNVLAKSRWMELTRADYDRAVARVPENMRFEFGTSPKRVQSLLNNLLVTKTLAAQARAHGTRPSTKFAPGPGDDSDRALATAELARIDADAAQNFAAQKASFETKAREVYALDREKYRTPEEVRISDIAIRIKDRGEDAALARAREARQKLVGGADFAQVAREYSDDPTTRDKGGALPFVSARSLAPEYAKSVFGLKTIGEISEPIRAPAAYHVVRLEERRPPRQQTFDEARDAIMRDLEKKYVAEQRDLRIQAIHSDPGLRVNQPAVEALVNRVSPEVLEKARPRARSRDPASK